MRKDNVRVAIWGLGVMGKGMAKMLADKKGVEIIGVCTRSKDLVGRDIYEILGVDRAGRPEAIVNPNIDEVLDGKNCDVCLCATDSFTKNAFPRIKTVLEKGINVISTAEEMSYPQAQQPELAKQLDEIAKKNGVTVLGTGINPGLIMDLLVVTLTGCMTDLTHVEAKRVNSLSPFGKVVMQEQGVGTTVEEFKKGVKDGTLSGHVGFEESISMIADAVGWEVDEIKTQMEPIVTSIDRKSPHGFAKAGDVAGANMTGQGIAGGKELINMIHPQQIEPEMEGTHTGDYITLKGTPEVNMAIKPEVEGGLGTIAMCVNMIPNVINSAPGLKTMLDLPVPRAIMGDMRKMITE